MHDEYPHLLSDFNCVLWQSFEHFTDGVFDTTCFLGGDIAVSDHIVPKTVVVNKCISSQVPHDHSKLLDLQRYLFIEVNYTSVAVKGSSDAAEIAFQTSAILAGVRVHTVALALDIVVRLAVPRVSTLLACGAGVLRVCPRAEDLEPPF